MHRYLITVDMNRTVSDRAVVLDLARLGYITEHVMVPVSSKDTYVDFAVRSSKGGAEVLLWFEDVGKYITNIVKVSS